MRLAGSQQTFSPQRLTSIYTGNFSFNRSGHSSQKYFTGHTMAAPFCEELLYHCFLSEHCKCSDESERYDQNPDFYFREPEVMCTKGLLLDCTLDTSLT